MRRKGSASILFLIVLILACTFSPNCLAYNNDSLDGAITDEISGLMVSGDIPSLHVCVVSGDEKWVKGFGEQTGEDTVFLVGSIQKVFVAVSILQLYDEGLVGLDDDVNTHMPFSIRHPGYPDTPITIRMLLSHRSGLDATLPSEFQYDWDGENPPEWKSFSEAFEGIPLEEWLEMNLDEDGSYYTPSHWVWEPDTRYSYSNNGYKILMCILERVTGKSIQDYMDEYIFTPLQMDHTGFDCLEFMVEHAIPHTRTRGDSTNKELPIWNGQYMLRSTVSDMGHLLIALMNEGQFDDYQLLKRDTVALMFENTGSMSLRSRLRDLLPIKDVLRVGYGLGIEVRNNGNFGHGGSTVGFTAECSFNPKTKRGFIRLSNVNAILDYTSNEWQDINSITKQIRTKVLLKIGLLPTIDIILIMKIITVGAIIMIFRGLYIRRHKVAENSQNI